MHKILHRMLKFVYNYLAHFKWFRWNHLKKRHLVLPLYGHLTKFDQRYDAHIKSFHRRGVHSLDGTGLELEASPLSSTNESTLSLNGRRSAGVQLDKHLQNSDIRQCLEGAAAAKPGVESTSDFAWKSYGRHRLRRER